MQLHSIGSAAREIGVPTHVLRHWEDMRVLVPSRTSAGHRRFSQDDIDRALMIRRAQRAGLSLGEIRVLLSGSSAVRASVVDARLAALRESIREQQSAVAFLEHTMHCRHRLIAACPECAAYVGANSPGPGW